MIKEYSKNNPGCYHAAIKYLAEIESTSPYKTLTFDKVESLYLTTKSKNPKKRKRLAYKSYKIKAIDAKGNEFPFYDNNLRFDARGVVAVRFEVEVLKRFEDFKAEVKNAGNYKDSLGGGWHSNCQLFEISGNYFAMMECSC